MNSFENLREILTLNFMTKIRDTIYEVTIMLIHFCVLLVQLSVTHFRIRFKYCIVYVIYKNNHNFL